MKALLRWFNHRRIQVVALATACAVLIGFSVVYYRPPTGISSYVPERDTQEFLSLFEADRYWLTESPNYSPEYMLANRAPNKNPLYKGKLEIKVLREQNQLVGFVCYFMKTPGHGTILFLEVNPEMRGKGYAIKLMKHALSDLKSRGATEVDLVTRTSNLAAQRVYLKTGFRETEREDKFVYYSHTF